MLLDRHFVAALSIAGSVTDVVGGMYLAYDLLGGKHGPLRTLTRCITYGLLFGLGVLPSLGLRFALIASVALGFTLGIEFGHASRGRVTTTLREAIVFSLIRGIAFAIGGALAVNVGFGIAFGLLTVAGQVFAYRIGFGPAEQYSADRKPRLHSRQVLGALNRTAGYAVAGFVCGAFTQGGRAATVFGLKMGITLGLVSAVLATTAPFIEWWADNLPERRLGAIGATLIVGGFALQSFQYWVVLLDIPLR